MDKNGYVTLYDEDGKEVLAIHLTEEGKRAYLAGEKISWYEGHFDIMLDLRGIRALGYQLGF